MSKAAEPDCPECNDLKNVAQKKAEATGAADGLALGECANLYETWASCIERENGQAKACAAVLKDFRKCHEASLMRALPPPR